MREQQADATRRRILAAARQLLLERGYAGTTVDALARAAGVAPQTVYAAFGSKCGIVAALLDRARFGPDFAAQVARAEATDDPEARLTLTAGIARRVYDAERAEFDLLSGAGAVSPALKKMERAHEDRRRAAQAPTVQVVADAGALRPGLDVERARDVLWAMTGRDLYRMLVVERGWSSDSYESCLATLLASALLAPERKRRRATERRSR